MVRAVVIDKFGDPDVFQLKELTLGKPGIGEVLVHHRTLGLNFIDVHQRRGTIPIPLPGIVGCEACGVVEAIGEGVQGIEIGDRVAYATAPFGAYCEARIIDQKHLINVPDYVSDEQVAALLLKGMTAHFLLRRTFFVRKDQTILVIAAAGGVGQLLCVLAKHYQAKVIAVVGSDAKAKIVQALGVDHVINYKKEDYLARVNEITKGQGVAAVYDSVGKDTFDKSLACVGYFGLLACYGTASGPIPLLDLERLRERGTFVTRPSIFTYKQDRRELLLSGFEIFALINKNVIKAEIENKYKLTQAPLAHHNLESSNTTGQSIFVV